jgi:hypothetical protein
VYVRVRKITWRKIQNSAVIQAECDNLRLPPLGPGYRNLLI